MLTSLTQANQTDTLLATIALGSKCIGSEVIDVSGTTPRGFGGVGSTTHFFRTPKYKEFLAAAKYAICCLVVIGDAGTASPLAFWTEHQPWDTTIPELTGIRTYGLPLDAMGVFQVSGEHNLSNFRIAASANLPVGVTLQLRVSYYG